MAHVPADPPELGPALLRWLQSFDFAQSVRSWRDLQDGHMLWRVLVDVEPAYFTGDLPEPATATADHWIPRWQNLKHINRLVMSFIRDDCGKLQELSKRMSPDLKAIATDASPKDSQELTKAVLLVALYSPESNQRMIQVLDRLGTKAGIAIAQCISTMEQADQKLVEAVAAQQTDTESDMERASSPEPRIARNKKRNGQGSMSEGRRDPQLENEERLIRAYTRIKQLEEYGATLAEELGQSRKDVGSLEKDVQDLNYQLEHGGSNAIDDEALEVLRQRSVQDKDNIAQLEAELEDARAEVESQEKQLDKLSRESEAYHNLQDEVDLLRTERDDLAQQSKANENLKRKIQTLQDTEKSSETSRQELAATQQELKVLRPLKQRIATLQKANEENAKTIQNGEQEIFDQKTTRRRLEHEMRLLTRQVESAKERHKQDQELLRQREEKGGPTSATSDAEAAEPTSLDDEFASRDQAFADVKNRNAQLEKELSALREAQSKAGADEPDSTTEQSAYDTLKARCEKLEKQYLDVYQENLSLVTKAKDSADENEEPQSFVQLHARLKDERESRLATEKRIFGTEAELTDTKLKLQSVEAKYAAVGKDKDEALKDLQHSASYENEILHTENIRLLDHLRTFEGDVEEQRSLLRHALLDKDAMQKMDRSKRFEDEVRLVTEQIRAVIDSPDRTDDTALRITQKIEDGRLSTAALEGQIAEEQQKREDLESSYQSRLKAAEEVAAKDVQSPDQQATQRELDLMTSAWYDLTRRMQSDSISVQRRADAPRSFLNRQRRLLSSTVVPKR